MLLCIIIIIWLYFINNLLRLIINIKHPPLPTRRGLRISIHTFLHTRAPPIFKILIIIIIWRCIANFFKFITYSSIPIILNLNISFGTSRIFPNRRGILRTTTIATIRTEIYDLIIFLIFNYLIF